MKRLLCTCLFITGIFCGAAQKRIVDVDKDEVSAAAMLQSVNGEPFTGFKFVRLVEGSPYYKEDWLSGSLLLEKGGRCKGTMKMDLCTNRLLYKDDKGNEFEALMPIRSVYLQGMDTVYTFIHRSFLPKTEILPKAQWFIQSYKGDSLQLYHFLQKQMVESQPYGSALTEQKIETQRWFVWVYRNKVIAFRKSKEATDALSEFRQSATLFLKNNPAKKQTEDELMLALAVYLDGAMKNQ